jgi:predicted RNA-binding protein with PIN domain
MPYLIDGHNLIPKIPSLSLKQIDDEERLIELLQGYCQRRRKNVEVFFDKAPPGQGRARSYGAVLARFIREEQTADAAIKARLTQLGRAARNWTVVSSDHSVRAAAHVARSHLLSSEEFADLLVQSTDTGSDVPIEEKDAPLDPAEIDEWLKVFKDKLDD